MRVVSWVHDFNPENVNTQDLKLPPELKQLNDQTKTLIRDFPSPPALANTTFFNNPNTN